jgi:transcriptional coactivator HFI1/ADA1
MQIDPAALSRPDSTSAAISSSSSSSKAVANAASASQKPTKALISVPRLELEAVYTDLKAAIGDNWGEYKHATTLFLLGRRTVFFFFPVIFWVYVFANYMSGIRPPQSR